MSASAPDVASSALDLVLWWGSTWREALQTTFEENPGHVIVEISGVLIIMYLLFHRQYDPEKLSTKLSFEEEQMLVDEWIPAPLASAKPASEQHSFIVSSHAGTLLNAAARSDSSLGSVRNFASFDFLGVSRSQAIRAISSACVQRFGVGSCGPRGFYGSVSSHLELEDAMSRFIGTEEAILYSDGIALMSSIIPAFSKATDVIVCDDAVNLSIRCGIELSRSGVFFFAHNDTDSLASVLEKASAVAREGMHRLFVIVEGLYRLEGDLCPLPEIVALKSRYHFRIILDDSCALGVLGSTGRGSVQHFHLQASDIDIWCASLEASIASVGGVCCGKSNVIGHQRLAGSGYVFSASSPMYTCAAAVASLSLVSKERERARSLSANIGLLREALLRAAASASATAGPMHIVVGGVAESPLIHLRVMRADASSPPSDESLSIYRLTQARLLLEHSLAVAVFEHRFRSQSSVRPSLCMVVQSEHDATMLSSIADIVLQTLSDVANNRTAIREASPSTLSTASKESGYSAAG